MYSKITRWIEFVFKAILSLILIFAHKALKTACYGGLSKNSKILQRLLEDERVDYNIEFCVSSCQIALPH